MPGLGVYLAVGAGLYVGGLGLLLVRRGPRAAASGVLLMLLASVVDLVAAGRFESGDERIPLTALVVVAAGAALVLVLVGLGRLRPDPPKERS